MCTSSVTPAAATFGQRPANTPLQTTNLGSNDKTFYQDQFRSFITLVFSTYYGSSNDDYDPVGERGIKFSNCRIYDRNLR